METTGFLWLSQELIDFISVICGLVLVGYYAYLIGLVMDKRPNVKKPTKKQFYLGLIPLAVWLIFFMEEFSELE